MRYAERLSDPVAPYATDEPCGDQGCEATRVREGYQFVLRGHRCHCKDEDILRRVLECIGKPEELLRTVGATRWSRVFGTRLRAAVGGLGRDPEPVARSDFDRAEFARLRAFVDGGQTPPDEAAAGQLVDDLTAVAAVLLRAKTMAQADREAAGLGDDLLDDTSGLLEAASRKLLEQAAVDLLDTLARPFAEAGLRTAARAAAQPAGRPVPGDLRLLAKGVAADNQLLATTVSALRRHKAWLLEKVEQTRAQTDCTLAADVAAVRIPVVQTKLGEGEGEGEGDRDPDPEGGRELAAAAERLALLTRRYLIACVCAAINPPCPACTDDDVLLAGIDVLDCEVEDICQVVRRYVPTGPNLRYWFPPLTWLPKLLEKLCCTDALLQPPRREGRDREGVSPIGEAGFLATGPRQAPAGTSARDRVLLLLGEELASLDPTGRGAALLPLSLSPALLRADLAQTATQSPDVRAVVGSIAADAVGDQLGQVRADARRQLEEVAAELSSTVAVDREVDATVNRQMTTVRRELGQYKSQTSRQLGRLESAVRERLAELEGELAEVRSLRDRLAQAETQAKAATKAEAEDEPDTANGNGPQRGRKGRKGDRT